MSMILLFHGELHIPEIVNLMEHQEISNILKVSIDYNEDLIRIFYVGLESKQGCSFRFKMGKSSYHFMQESWKDVFGIFMLSHEPTLSDHAFRLNFDWKNHLKSCLRVTRIDDDLDRLSTGLLKRDPHILQWIITHMLRPRKGGHYQIDQVEVHLMYILQNKVKINWPNYFVSRMFAFRDSNRGSFLCYTSMIANILKHFHIGVPNLVCISPGHAQEFNKSTMSNMGYHWDNNIKAYYYRLKRSSELIYNYDDLA